MIFNQEKISEKKISETSANFCEGTNAVQLKNNREYPAVQKKLTERTPPKQVSFMPVQKK